jgi:hypothetical protein
MSGRSYFAAETTRIEILRPDDGVGLPVSTLALHGNVCAERQRVAEGYRSRTSWIPNKI